MELRDTDIPLIQSVAQYKMMFNEPAQRQVFPVEQFGSDASALKVTGEALTALSRNGYLKDRHAGKRLMLPGGRKYYILDEKALTIIGNQSESATKPPGPQALALNLSVLWFCCMKRKQAHRLTPEDLKAALPGKIPLSQNVVHCLREEDGMAAIYRMYLATAKSPKRSAEQLGSHIKAAIQDDCCRPLVKSGEYRFAVLAPTPEAGKGVRNALGHTLERLKGTIPADISPQVTFELAPLPETLGLALAQHKESLQPR